ncbi:LysR family transcriptional regulator [Mesorhizobium sp. B1-1-8]|uniref:LysR family transcriptional regulator n=1 Tax=Mesorhizobium sp. B1-1-8 TaxID=2589976 RepID=UPI00112C8FD0|nr:LysR family transcriptional regulator [Mesorhizobium sp. B1-1-8]UCI07058.1 LysR family transcriptional regulator [Mesorhizobium sp. B1-1-8]
MVDRLSGIHEFVATVETGGFAAAATKLHLSRSAVGKSISRLEERLGVRLFHRTTRVVKLTQDGSVFYEHCQNALATLKSGESALQTGRTEPTGKVRISVPAIFGRYCVAPVLYEVAAKYPALMLEIGFTDRPVDVVREGYDLAIRNGNVANEAGLATRTLARQRMVVCGSPAYFEKRGRPAALADLQAHEAIYYANPARIRTWLFRDGQGDVTEVAMNGRIRLDDIEAMADAAAAGMGLAWLPCWLVKPRVASGELVTVLENLTAIEFNSSALWPQAPSMPLRVRVLIDALAERLPGMVG